MLAQHDLWVDLDAAKDCHPLLPVQKATLIQPESAATARVIKNSSNALDKDSRFVQFRESGRPQSLDKYFDVAAELCL